MANPAKTTFKVENADETRDQWLTTLRELLVQVRRWAEGGGWKIRVIEKSMNDSILGRYKAPAMLMQRDTVEVILDPVGRFAPGTDGVVDLYMLPAYDDIASLYLVNGEWRLHYAFRSSGAAPMVRTTESMTLDEVSLHRVLDEIAAHVA
jgi:hypothetical protein